MKLQSTVASAFVLAALPAISFGQQNFVYPHGDLTVDVGCGSCHRSDGWRPTKDPLDFDHGVATGFRLEGKHSVLPCNSCHIDLNFSEPKLASRRCATCHVDVHRGRHSLECESCHSYTTFSAVDGIGVHVRTNFPLTGAHELIVCESCHTDDVGGAYTPRSTECYSCHAEEYSGTQFVDHLSAGFSTECQECHTTLAWGHSVAFDHATSASGYELLGRHREILCSSCHIRGVAGSIYSPSNQYDCITCHQTDYSDQHGGTGFPTTCLACHTNDSWRGATFEDHDNRFFPIFSGPHRGQWAGCETCHVVAGDFTQFTCFNCHEHRQSETDEHHSEVAGYLYESTACYSCHPGGRSP